MTQIRGGSRGGGGGGLKGSMEPPFERASLTRDTLIEQSNRDTIIEQSFEEQCRKLCI